MMKGSAEFVLGFLVESPDGYLVTNPSHSPENTFSDTRTGEKSQLTYAATIDIEIIKKKLVRKFQPFGLQKSFIEAKFFFQNKHNL